MAMFCHNFGLCHMLDACLTGYGGGFNERENLVYNEREESDGEYDEVSGDFYISVYRDEFLLLILKNRFVSFV